MRILPTAHFHQDFPDDTIEDEHDIVQFPGLNVSEAIVEHLTSAGYEVSEPEHQQEHGWDFTARSEGCEIWLQIQVVDSDENYLSTDLLGLPLSSSQREKYGELLTTLHNRLSGDPRFSSITWRDKIAPSGIEGAPGPVVD